MAESEKGASSSISSKEKSSLLDLDIGTDFLSSWKSMNVTEDVAMDFDFGPVAKVNSKAFKGLDFDFDGDFDKISSFRVDMSDLDISSPLKKDGKSKERFKGESVNGNNKEKADSFSFPFDFHELDTFSFESSLMRKDKQANKNQDSEESAKRNECQSSGIHLTEVIGALIDSSNLNLPSSGGVTSSRSDTEVRVGGDLASEIENFPSKSVTNDKLPEKSATFENKVELHGLRTSPEKTVSMNTQEMGQQEKIASPDPEAFHQETMQDVSVQSLSGTASTQATASELQEEVSSQPKNVSAGSSSEQNVNVKPISSSGSDYENTLLENSAPPHIESLPIKNSERSTFGVDNHALMGIKDGPKPAQSDSQLKSTFGTSVSRETLHHRKITTENQGLTSKPFEATLRSGTTVDSLMLVEERETGAIRSKFFRRSDETESQLHRGSSPQTNTLSGRTKIGTVQLNTADERREHADPKDAQSGSTLAGVSLLHPRELTRGEPVHPGSQESFKGLDCIRSHIKTSSFNEKKNESTPRDYVNPRLPVFGMKSIQNLKNFVVDRSEISHRKAVRTSDLSSLKISRIDGAKCDPQNSISQKDIKSPRNLEQNIGLQGKEAPSIGHSLHIEKQTPPTPPLKRKTFELSTGNMPTLNPSKRLSQSPRENRTLIETPEKVPDGQVGNHEGLTDGNTKSVPSDYHSSALDISCEVNMKELKTPLPMENDSNIEKAEACTKELEGICNMLKKKHEGAKEILLRAIVNNNNLLMLNHPIFEEKIQRVQKFASRLMSK